MKILIKNAYILTCDDSFKIIKNGQILVENNEVVEVSSKEIQSSMIDRVIDFNGDIAMPGLINAHTHSAMTLFRGLADDLTLEKWLFEKIFPLEANLNYDHIYYGSMLAVYEYVRGGTTTIGDMYFMPETMLKIASENSFNIACVGGGTDLSGNCKGELETLENRFVNLNNKSEFFKYNFGAHAEYTTSDEFIDGLVGLAYKYKTSLYAHASETLKEVGECTVRHKDLSPIMYFHKMGFFDNGATLAHCVHVDKDDIALMKQCGVNVVTNPGSNLKLASGIAPLYTMHNQGLNIAIGTDGAGSNNSLSMLREMYLASVLAKVTMNDAKCIDACDIIKMATRGGAFALGYDSKGIIASGMDADIIRIDINSINFTPKNELHKHIVYSCNDSLVKMTMANGVILYEDGNFNLSEKFDTVKKECEKSIKELVKLAK